MAILSKNKVLFRLACLFVSISFLLNTISPSLAFAQDLTLPSPTQLVPLSDSYSFPLLKGMKFDPSNPLNMEFIIDTANKQKVTQDEASILIKYFLAGLTIPEEELWVNMSPYEQDKMITPNLAQTDLGKDLLSQDYILKQLSSSLTYPETEIGKDFWIKTYQEVLKVAQTTNIPVNTFNKIWIVPDKALVEENGNFAFIKSAGLKAMLEEDYLALKNNIGDIQKQNKGLKEELIQKVNAASSQVVRNIILPKITNEINQGKNFATLRQIYYSLVLGVWFKKRFKDSIYSYYINQGNVKGIDLSDKGAKDKIYNLYVEAFKKGVYNYTKSEKDLGTGRNLKRQYFSGGFSGVNIGRAVEIGQIRRNENGSFALDPAGPITTVQIELKPEGQEAKAATANSPLRSTETSAEDEEIYNKLASMSADYTKNDFSKVLQAIDDIFAEIKRRLNGPSSNDFVNRLIGLLEKLKRLEVKGEIEETGKGAWGGTSVTGDHHSYYDVEYSIPTEVNYAEPVQRRATQVLNELGDLRSSARKSRWSSIASIFKKRGKPKAQENSIKPANQSNKSSADSPILLNAEQTKEMTQKLENLKEYMPEEASVIWEFGKFLSQRLGLQQISTEAFLFTAALAIDDLSTGTDSSTGNLITGRLSSYPAKMWDAVYLRVPQIAKAVCPYEFAKEIESLWKEIYLPNADSQTPEGSADSPLKNQAASGSPITILADKVKEGITLKTAMLLFDKDVRQAVISLEDIEEAVRQANNLLDARITPVVIMTETTVGFPSTGIPPRPVKQNYTPETIVAFKKAVGEDVSSKILFRDSTQVTITPIEQLRRFSKGLANSPLKNQTESSSPMTYAEAVKVKELRNNAELFAALNRIRGVASNRDSLTAGIFNARLNRAVNLPVQQLGKDIKNIRSIFDNTFDNEIPSPEIAESFETLAGTVSTLTLLNDISPILKSSLSDQIHFIAENLGLMETSEHELRRALRKSIEEAEKTIGGQKTEVVETSTVTEEVMLEALSRIKNIQERRSSVSTGQDFNQNITAASELWTQLQKDIELIRSGLGNISKNNLPENIQKGIQKDFENLENAVKRLVNALQNLRKTQPAIGKHFIGVYYDASQFSQTLNEAKKYSSSALTSNEIAKPYGGIDLEKITVDTTGATAASPINMQSLGSASFNGGLTFRIIKLEEIRDLNRALSEFMEPAGERQELAYRR